jgi:hypothetical protein
MVQAGGSEAPGNQDPQSTFMRSTVPGTCSRLVCEHGTRAAEAVQASQQLPLPAQAATLRIIRESSSVANNVRCDLSCPASAPGTHTPPLKAHGDVKQRLRQANYRVSNPPPVTVALPATQAAAQTADC